MGDTPPFRDIILKQLCQFFRRLACDRISPCPEGNKESVLLVKSHVSVHHGAETNSRDLFDLCPVGLLYILHHILIAPLESLPDIIQGISPDMAVQPVLPCIASGSDRDMIFIDHDCLDPGRSKLNADNSLPFLYHLFYLFCVCVHLLLLLLLCPFFLLRTASSILPVMTYRILSSSGYT